METRVHDRGDGGAQKVHGSQDSSTQTSLSLFPALKHLFLNAAAVCITPRKASSVNYDEDNALLTRLLPPNIELLCLAAWVQESVKARIAKALLYLARTVRTVSFATRSLQAAAFIQESTMAVGK